MHPPDPAFDARVRQSFARQTFMVTLGAHLVAVRSGEVMIDLPFREGLVQQHGFLHAGVITSVVDSACGYAALTLMASEAEVLTVEFKVNLLAPAIGELFQAVGRVVRPGRTLTVCVGELRAAGVAIAIMQATMMTVIRRSSGRN
jgi:uncharacterized protein (TIGR00369 family)